MFPVRILCSRDERSTATSDAGAGIGYTGFRIRGTDPSRINVTINGIPLNDSESQGVWWVNMPDFASSLENIQIQRGVGTSTNGAAAFGASINLQTIGLNTKAYAKTNNSVGSYNTLKNNIGFGTGLINNKFTFDARLSRISSDGYIDRATSDLKSLYVQGPYFDDKSTLVREGLIPRSVKFQDKFHSISLIWQKDSIEFFLDNEEEPYFKIDKSHPEFSKYNYPFNRNYYMIINVAVGGKYDDYMVDKNAFCINTECSNMKNPDNQRLLIDWIEYEKLE